MSGKKADATSIYLRRLGLHHFAHLRAIANGFDIQAAAKQYLGIEHGHEAITAHRRVVDHLRAVARRHGERSWRLIGLVISPAAVQVAPSLDAWAAERGLEDFYSEAELMELYAEAFPPDRKGQRNQRLRERQLRLLRELEQTNAQAPKLEDEISGWFDEATSARLLAGRISTLQELADAIGSRERWWADIRAIGAGKAKRIEAFLRNLLGQAMPEARLPGEAPLARLAALLPPIPSAPSTLPCPALPYAAAAQVDGASESNGLTIETISRTLEPNSGTTKSNSGTTSETRPHLPDGITIDLPPEALAYGATEAQLIATWIAARAGSVHTAKTYRREADRFRLFMLHERGRSMLSCDALDCLGYMAFLESIPDRWLSTGRLHRTSAHWAPFSKQLDLSSRKQAVVVVASFFEWLMTAKVLQSNPWSLVNRKVGDDRQKRLLETRAFTKDQWLELRRFVSESQPGPTKARTQFLLDFGESVGLRSSEFVGARLGDFARHKEAWVLQVFGKGARNRVVAVPTQALHAIEDYLVARGLPELAAADPALPLVASAKDPLLPVTYRPLYESTKNWFTKAFRASNLPASERIRAQQASMHWLRHTCGTRALERGVKLQILQSQFGHADPRTTMRYSKSQLDELVAGMEEAFKE